MPNRILRDAILTSERVASLDWAAEVFYRRLHSIVDDYGRYEAGHQLLRAKCYPLQTDSVRVADIARWMAACQKSGLILVYGANGKQYLEVCDFRQQTRTDSKCPPPPAIDACCDPLLAIDSKCQQPLANDCLGVVVGVSVNEAEQGASPAALPAAAKSKQANGTRLPDDWELPNEWAEWAKAERPDLNPADVAAVFADHWRAKPGKDGRKTDWLATWRNWVRKERAGVQKPSAPSAVPRGKPVISTETPLEAALARIQQDYRFDLIDAIERDKRIAEATAKYRSAN
jgi:hypothetical protein